MSMKKTGKTATKKRPAAAKKASAATASGAKAKTAGGGSRGDKEQIRALSSMSGDICEDAKKLQSVLDMIKDASAPLPVRMAALQTMLAASFSAANFDACRPDFLAALRSVVADPELEIRQRVLGILSREHDGYAQQVLLDGLREPAKALLPPEKALQLLSYDIHTEAYPVARQIIQNPPNPAAKLEAMRLLAADAASAPVFEKILRNKREPEDVRQLSASALHGLDPQKLQEHARKIVLDKSEGDQLRATSLTAITQFAKHPDMIKDSALQKRVDELRTGEGSAALKRVSRRFLAKFSR